MENISPEMNYSYPKTPIIRYYMIIWVMLADCGMVIKNENGGHIGLCDTMCSHHGL